MAVVPPGTLASLFGCWWQRVVVCALGVAALPVPARGEDAPKDGLFITVLNPITQNSVLQIERRMQDAVERQGRNLRTVVFDFNPLGKPAGTNDHLQCMGLEKYIFDLGHGQIPKCPNVWTVAYVQNEVTDHTVLPVLACREIVMSSKGKLGQILGGQDRPLAQEAQLAYENVIKKAWPIPNLLSRLKDRALIDSEEAWKMGLCKARLDTRPDVKNLYGLPALSLREDALVGRTPVVWRIEIHGALDKGKLNSLERRIKEAIRKKANVLILHLDCDGGETTDAAAKADWLRTLTDYGGDLPVKTIAYVPPRKTLGAATFLALGCSEIAMAPDAKLGGFDYLKKSAPEDLKVQQKMLVELTRSQGYPIEPVQAMIDPKGEFASLDARAAQDLGIAQYSDITTPERLYERYGFDGTKVETSRDDWLDGFAEFLRMPIINILLIMVGVAGLILELKIPGFGVPGIIAAICFVLFFWSHAFAGQSTWEFTLLAVLLFILGLVLLGMEIFLLPGFGVTGISGIALIVISLVLMLLEQMPSTAQEWGNLGAALTTVGIGLVAGMVAAVAIARYLPNIPYANRLVLEPPAENELGGDANLTQEGLQASALLGAFGVATTTLRPSGMAQFGEQFLDVVAEGDFVESGAHVQVIEIEGNRIVVKEVR